MNRIPEQIFKELILKGVNEFMYESYDHKSAVEHGAKPNTKATDWMDVPDQLKQKFLIWRRGKIRDMAFCPDGGIKKIYVSNKFLYKKVFYPTQFGLTVKPIIFESDDEHGLIKKGLAHKQTI